MCFGRFLHPLPPALPLSLPGCRDGFNPTGDRFFLSVGTHIGHADANALPSDGTGRAKNGASFFLFFSKIRNSSDNITGKGGASLTCYSWDHHGDPPLLFHCHPRCCQAHGWLVSNPLLCTRYYNHSC